MTSMFRWCLATVLLIALSVFSGVGQDAHGQREPAFRVIVHPSSTVESLPKKEVSRMFLKRRTQWPDGGQVTPVDLPESSDIRRQFSRTVHGRGVDIIANYWVREIFSGKRVPPKQLKNAAQVVEFVRDNEGAIGYVNPGAVTDEVKVLEVIE
ncbi:MAG: phosphate ABC transporter substrate-binding protein [Thermoanaerobaculia bacterium]|nr:phosphate ABC transporter substrate-binding protein [Thermoanaerobaculia bacterium]